MIEIFIEGRMVDADGSTSSLLTFALDDVKNFAQRSTAFSKTVVLPGTFLNNQLFGNIFEVGQANEYNPAVENVGYNFNAAKSARCLIFQDNLQAFKGTVRLLEIIKTKGSIEYEVAFHGEITSLSVALSSGYLEDLDFSEHDIVYTAANIAASWSAAAGSNVYFPLIDYGTYSTNKHDWDIRTFRPALHVKEYIDKMFEKAGFRYSSALINSDRFKELIVPHNQKRLTRASNYTLDVSPTDLSRYEHTDGPFYIMNLNVQNTIQDFTYDAVTSEYTYTGTQGFTGVVSVVFSGVWQKTGDQEFSIAFEKNGAPFYEYKFGNYSSDRLVPFEHTANNISLSIAPGDKLRLVLANNSFGSGETGFVELDVRGQTRLAVSNGVTLVDIRPNDKIVINETLPKNIRQIDFLTSIVKLFNLYVYEDKFDENLILMQPFVEYYNTDPKDALDWSYKIDRDSPIRVRPMSELNFKIYEFAHATDSDYYNEVYRKRYNKNYGTYVFDSEFEFVSQTTKLELIFAPTPLVGYDGEDKIYSTIFKRSGTDAAPVEETTDSVIRILQRKKLTCSSWSIKDGATILGSYTEYGYAGHFDNPTNITTDLNFGAAEELFFKYQTGDLSKTQFNEYWDEYMREITDKDSKLLIGKFYLTTQDISNLDFSRYIFVDGVLFRLNKILDWNATQPSLCTVELLKVIDTVYNDPYLLYQGPPGDYTHPLVDSDNKKFYYHAR